MDKQAPYLRIADEILDRIARGDLAPGDRVPSTRRITIEWGVAMATATKVIAELKHVGAVHTRSGSGTVVRATAPGAGAETNAGTASGESLSPAESALSEAMAEADEEAESVEPPNRGGVGSHGGAESGAAARTRKSPMLDVDGSADGDSLSAAEATSASGVRDRVDPGTTAAVDPVASVEGEAVSGTKTGEEGEAEVRSGSRCGALTRAATGGRAGELSQEKVVRGAVAIADIDGLGMLTMRRVATELGVATMSLYRHVANKDELVLLMVDRVFGEQSLPEPPAGWRDRLTIAGQLLWSVFRRHPWAAEVLSMTRPQLMPNLLGYAEWTLSCLRELGMDLDDTMYAYLSVIGYVRGTAMSIQAEVQAERDTGMTSDEWMDSQEEELWSLAAAGTYPNLEFVTRQQFAFDLDAVFEYGLQRMLDGLEVRVRAINENGGATA